jgi:DNA-binding transcriptional LysR family regulator
MTLTQLRTLLAVADAGSVRGASERLLVSQPAISGAVASLERELGVELVRREGRGLRFTPAGRAFVSSVRAGLALVEYGVRQAKSIEEPGRGTVLIAAVTTAAERMLLPLLAEFRRHQPHADVVVRVGNRATVWQALREGGADLVVAGRPPPALRARTLGRADNRLIVVGPPAGTRPASGSAGSVPPTVVTTSHGRLRQRLVALSATTWLLREEGSGTREATDELLAKLGLDPPRMILGSNGAVEQAAIAGLGVALISAAAVAGSLASGQLAVYECRGTPLDRPWHLVASSLTSLTPTAALAARLMLSSPAGFVPAADGRQLVQA